VLEKDNDAGLIQKQTANKIIAHAPEPRQLFDRVMAFERRFLPGHDCSMIVSTPDATLAMSGSPLFFCHEAASVAVCS
jgi:hypothetical protein